LVDQSLSHRLFLDANVIFSAAYRSSTHVRELWLLPDAELLTSSYAILEAQRNLPATRYAELESLLRPITVVPEPEPGAHPLPPSLALPVKDAPIFLAAAAARATHLLSGDKRHFGAYFGKQFDGVLILTPRSYLQSRGSLC
jgi:uncharacterized protein